MVLDSAVEDALDSGRIATLQLIRFDLPGKTAGYHMGGRPYTYNGLVYLPNKYLHVGDEMGNLGAEATSRGIVFANVPSLDGRDIINQIESYNYTNAPVIVTTLVGAPESSEVIGILSSSVYEINEVNYSEGEADDRGERTTTIEIELEQPGRSARGATHVKRSPEEQHFDNDPTDTSLRYVAVNAQWKEEWGQRG